MGPIMVFEVMGATRPSVACPEPLGIFDGQHRARASARLLSSEDFSIQSDGGSDTAAAQEADEMEADEVSGMALTAPAASMHLRAGKVAPDSSGLFEDFPMLVEVYPVRSEQDVKRLYLEVNKSESVKVRLEEGGWALGSADRMAWDSGGVAWDLGRVA